jgi:hypothetical protein
VERECPEFGNLFNNLQFSALQLAIEHAGRQPFIWLEQDSIPLSTGWASVISAEYKEAGKQFMLSSDTYPPHDLVGGIGVYGSDSHWLLPKWIEHHGWDRWMIDNLPDLIHRTPVIQHNYCKWDYELKKCGRKWMFPMDAKIIRPDAVIFHSDPSQSLLSCFSHVAA